MKEIKVQMAENQRYNFKFKIKSNSKIRVPDFEFLDLRKED